MKILIKNIVILLIFILGYICGNIGKDTILSSFILTLSKLEIIEIIGLASSIISLVLFITYIIGRCFMINEMKVTISETFDLFYNDEERDFKVVEEYDIGDNNTEKIYLKSSETLRWIKVYESEYNEKNNKFNKGRLLLNHNLLKRGFAVKLNTYLPCGIPSYIIEYQRYDFIIGELVLAENGKNGILEEQVSIKHTIKSILYYLVK
nr:hypothetical protein [uncultured Romboutsia sp.]